MINDEQKTVFKDMEQLYRHVCEKKAIVHKEVDRLTAENKKISGFADARLTEIYAKNHDIEKFKAKLKAKDDLLKELVSANPDCCWRKCWSCGKKQIHRESITPGVLCRFCGSQDTRLLKKETQALKG